jgi:hypothetical protein
LHVFRNGGRAVGKEREPIDVALRDRMKVATQEVTDLGQAWVLWFGRVRVDHSHDERPSSYVPGDTENRRNRSAWIRFNRVSDRLPTMEVDRPFLGT